MCPKSVFMRRVLKGSQKVGKELNIYTYLRRVKRMDAALEILLSKNKRTLLEYQDKVRYIIEVDPNEIAKGNSNDASKVNPDNSMNEMVDLSKGMSDDMINKNADCRLMNA